MQFTTRLVNMRFVFYRRIQKLCLSNIFYPYPQFLLSLGYTIEVNTEWGRKLDRVSTGCTSGLINAYSTVTVEYLLCSLVQCRKLHTRTKIGPILAIRKIV